MEMDREDREAGNDVDLLKAQKSSTPAGLDFLKSGSLSKLAGNSCALLLCGQPSSSSAFRDSSNCGWTICGTDPPYILNIYGVFFHIIYSLNNTEHLYCLGYYK